jgi:hypothetical protein
VREHETNILVLIIAIVFIGAGVTLIDPIGVNGQSKGRMVPSQESGRDPFLLPVGVRLLSKDNAASGMKGVSSKKETERGDTRSSPLKVNAILISDHIRLALIDRHIVTIGDPIQDNKVLEIKTDGVILGKDHQKKTLLLSQSPVLLSVEETPPTLTLPRKGGGKQGGKGE